MEKKKRLIKRLGLLFAAILTGTLLTGLLFFFITSQDINESMAEEKLQYARILASYLAEEPKDAERLKNTHALEGYSVQVYEYPESGKEEELLLKAEQRETVENGMLHVFRMSEKDGSIVEVSGSLEELYEKNRMGYLRIFAVLLLCAAAGWLIMAGIIVCRAGRGQGIGKEGQSR